MNVNLIAHTQLSGDFADMVGLNETDESMYELADWDATDGQALALTAIRTCYSPNKPSDILAREGEKYFGNKASDGADGTDADRLIRHIVRSGHSSTLEHLSFTFAIEGVSRALLAQLTRHRVGFSFSVQSQRYVRLGSGDKSGGAEFVVPPKVRDTDESYYLEVMSELQRSYDILRKLGVPPEDARMVLPNAAATNLVMTANLTALLSFYAKRRKGNGAQWEIADLAEELRQAVAEVEPWTDALFEQAKG